MYPFFLSLISTPLKSILSKKEKLMCFIFTSVCRSVESRAVTLPSIKFCKKSVCSNNITSSKTPNKTTRLRRICFDVLMPCTRKPASISVILLLHACVSGAKVSMSKSTNTNIQWNIFSNLLPNASGLFGKNKDKLLRAKRMPKACKTLPKRKLLSVQAKKYLFWTGQ